MVRKVPPLNALKAFEASARLGSYVLAAAELHVTPGAVSQQIQKLEDFLGRQLFLRRSKQLILTDVGMSVQTASTEMMDGLEAMTRRLMDSSLRSNLIISVLPSLLVHWLNRRLPEFLRANPDVRVDLRLEDDPVDFYRNRIDIRISYGEHLYPDLVTVPFRQDRVTAMCTPELLKSGRVRGNVLESLQDEDLIHVSWRNGFSSYPTWDSWFAAAGSPRQPRRELGHTVDMSSVAVDLARSGAGVALGQFLLAEEDLEQGILVTPFSTSIAFQYHYCVVHTPANSHNPMLRAFITWLRGLPTT
jgi:LysR family glycine cleavage system transcriptional activator